MEKNIKLSLQEELKQETEEIKQNIDQHPELARMKVSKEMDAEFFKRAKELEEELKIEKLYEEEVEREASVANGEHVAKGPGTSVYVDESGEEYILVPRKKRKRPWLAALVAILVLVLGLSMTSIGSKSYFKALWERFAGEDENPMKILNVEDMDAMSSEDGREATAYREIGEKLGIYVVEIRERPEDMDLIEVQIEETLTQAILFYRHGEEIIRYTVYLNDEDSSWGETEEDDEIRKYTITVDDVDIIVKEYEAQDYETYRRVAEFSYRGVHYQLKGIMEQEEFELILKNLHFF